MKQTKRADVFTALKWGRKRLDKSLSPALDARILLAWVLKISSQQILQDTARQLTSAQYQRYQKLVNKRREGWPIAYLTGVKEFYGHELKVTPAVLIPRPSSEAIVMAAVKIARANNIRTIYEVGTGSGALAIALAKELPRTKIIASDISAKALAVAKQNIQAYKLTRRIKVVRADLGGHIKKAKLVVANLPYLPIGLKVKRDLKFEPRGALYAKDNGLALYKKLFQQTKMEYVVIELGARQAEPMSKWLKDNFPHVKIEPVKDIDGTACGLKVRLR